jgi:3-oxoacyl-[acyl-carrier protein] reductase
MRLEGRVALVPASTRGIGRAIATELAMRGASVAICARSRLQAAEAAGEIEKVSGARVQSQAVDLCDAEQIRDWVYNSTKTLGSPDILVLNSGGPPLSAASSAGDDDFRTALDLVFLSAVRLLRYVTPAMVDAGWGRVVSVSSFSARQPVAMLAPSVAARGALLGHLKMLANELGSTGITVNSLLVGPVATDRVVDLARAQGGAAGAGDALASLAAMTVVGRLGRPEEIAALVSFLCSEAASYITGTAIPADGGAIRAV